MCLASLNKRGFVWILLAVLAFFSIPSVTGAQQPSATIRALSGEVSVSGTTPATTGTVLRPGDTIQTQTGASVVLELSDGSRLELGEKTTIDIAQLVREPVTGARISLVKLTWGRIRAFLSPEHQKEGSSFEVRTPDALVGVKFSKPDIEVIYEPDTRTTIVFAYTVEVIITNLVSGETAQLKPGEQGIVQGHRITTSSLPEERRRPNEKLPRKHAVLLQTRRGVSASTGRSVPRSLPGQQYRGSWPGGRLGKPEHIHPYGISINIYDQ
jgi:hypothetical protein